MSDSGIIQYLLIGQSGNFSLRTDYLWGMSKSFTYDPVLKSRLTSWSINNVLQAEVLYDNNGNIVNKSDVSLPGGSYLYNSGNKPHAVHSVTSPTPAFRSASYPQNIEYTAFNKVNSIHPGTGGENYEITYGTNNERVKSLTYVWISKTSPGMPIKTKYYLGDYEIEVNHVTKKTRDLHYLSAGDGLFAILVTEGTASNLYYIHKDHLGSYNAITDATGNLVETLSFDPWGRRRNPTNWTYNNVPASFLFDRGYTGHEHLDKFGLINMNGRVYDPFLARFLSPDPFVQAPGFSQSFNRYSYAWNNPLVYTDPDGEWIFTILASVIPGAQFLIPAAIIADLGWISGGIRAQSQGKTFWYGAWRGGVTGVVAGGLSMIGGAGMPFISNLALGTSSGAITGGLDAALWGNDIGKGMLWGAAAGAVFTTLSSENLRNAMKGEGFYTNKNVFNNFMNRPDMTCQGIVDYFGIDATYRPIKAGGAEYVEGTSYFGSTHPIKGTISMGDEAFTSYDNLRGTYQKEMFTSNRVLRGEKLAIWNDHGKDLMRMKYYPEEALGLRNAFRNQGLYPKATLNWSNQANFYWKQVYDRNLMKDRAWYYIFNKIPRRW